MSIALTTMNAKPLILLVGFALIIPFSQCEKYRKHVYIPDAAFLNALIIGGVDTNGDGKISPAEAEVVTYLNVSEKGISDMTGIEAFINLDTLFCSKNQLTSLDVSENAGLHILLCPGNQLTSLNVSSNFALTVLQCYDNQLTSVDVSNRPDLYIFHCFNNRLTSLDVTKSTKLVHFWCYDNQLNSLDVSNNTMLKSLYCENNQLASLDVSNNTRLRNLKLGEMPSLTEVCVWILPFPPEEVHVNTEGSPNVHFTTECSK